MSQKTKESRVDYKELYFNLLLHLNVFAARANKQMPKQSEPDYDAFTEKILANSQKCEK